MQSFTRTHRTALSACIICYLLLTANAGAQIVTDGSVGPAQNLSGPDFSIPESLGSRAGGNLFHSFQRFSILTGQSATFSGASEIINVISRVTGGDPSTIDGVLRSTVGQADFYFLNPAGVLFDANAQVDVPGSFYVSTADQLRFADSAVYDANNPVASILSFDQPASFGFLGDQTASITHDGNTISLTPGKTLSFTAGELHIDDATLFVEGGDIQLVATGDAANTVTMEGDLSAPARGTLNISRSRIDTSGTSGNGAGRIVFRSGASQLNSSEIFADNIGPTPAGSKQGIDIQAISFKVVSSAITTDILGQGQGANLSMIVAEDLSIVNGSRVGSITGAAGNAGDVSVRARTLTVDGQDSQIFTGIASGTESGGDAGIVTVNVDDEASIVNGGDISSNTFAAGDGGQVNFRARTLTVDGQGNEVFTGISSKANFNSGGNSGIVAVNVDEAVSIVNGGTVSGSTFGEGNAGQVHVTAGKLTIDGQRSKIVTGITSQANLNLSGNAGTVTVKVDGAVSIVNGGTVSNSTFGEGNAGQVQVTAGSLKIDGQRSNLVTGIASQSNPGSPDSGGNAGFVTVNVKGAASIVNGGQVNSDTFGKGDAGQVRVTAGTLTINGQGSDSVTGITSQASIDSTGNAGTVTVNVKGALSIANGGAVSSSTVARSSGNGGQVSVSADTLAVDGQGSKLFTGIASQTGPGSTGNAGTITVSAEGALSIVNGAIIDSTTFGQGHAGQVRVKAGTLMVDRQGSNLATGITSKAVGSSGQAGNIKVDTQNLSILNGGSISIESEPTVEPTALASITPTEINIKAQNITLRDSSITTESLGNVPAGSITLNVADTLSLDPSRISTAANNANGGAISIQAKVIDLQDSQITTSVRGQGDGGNIDLTAKVMVLDSGFIQANAAGANARGGDIRIDTDALVASQNLFVIGGGKPLSFQPGLNVIQAAAPDGVSGSINITSPQLDISGDLTDLEAELLDIDQLTQDPCSTPGGQQSRLARLGRGGLPESPEHAGSVVIDSDRLQRLLPGTEPTRPLSSASDQPTTTRHSTLTIESLWPSAHAETEC